jgi:CDP-diacylglycerol--glycerol-3-phosphate 3-phosphatidyltransferase
MTAFSLPLSLTLTRFILSPLCMPVLILEYLPTASCAGHVLVTAVFLALGFTDFLDGHLARRLGKESLLGALLDPVADKLLVTATAISLVAIGLVPAWWTIVVVGRDFFVMSLRELALASRFRVPVARLGKLKTVLQMFYLAFVLAGGTLGETVFGYITLILLYASFVCTILSAYQYFMYWNNQRKTLGS